MKNLEAVQALLEKSTAVDNELPVLTFADVPKKPCPLTDFHGFSEYSAYEISTVEDQVLVAFRVEQQPSIFCFHVGRIYPDQDCWRTLLMDCCQPSCEFSQAILRSIPIWAERQEATRLRRALFAEQAAEQARWQEGIDIQNTGRRSNGCY